MQHYITLSCYRFHLTSLNIKSIKSISFRFKIRLCDINQFYSLWVHLLAGLGILIILYQIHFAAHQLARQICQIHPICSNLHGKKCTDPSYNLQQENKISSDISAAKKWHTALPTPPSTTDPLSRKTRDMEGIRDERCH